MAFQVTLVPDVTPDVTAAADLRTKKNLFVQVTASGVNIADVRSMAYTGTYVLQNKPNTGEACALTSAPSIAKVYAGEAITRGQCVQPMSASGLAGVTSGANIGFAGIAWTTAAGSGELLAVKMRW